MDSLDWAAPPGGLWNKLLGRMTPVVERRMIRFVRAEHDGSYDPNDWREIEFHGRSVHDLRSAVAEHLNEGNVHRIKLCVRAGTLGRVTPIVIDLPRNGEPIDFVALSTFTPVAELGRLTPLAIDLTRNEKPIDFGTLSTNTADGVLSLEKPGLEKLAPPPPGTLGQLTPLVIDQPRNEEPIDFGTLCTSTPVAELGPPLVIDLPRNEDPIDFAGAALGEHPSIGVNNALEQLRGAESVVQYFLHEEREMEEKMQGRQRDMHKNHRQMSEKEKARKLQKLKVLKTEIQKKKKVRSALEQEAHNAGVAYERAILRAPNE